MQKQNRSREKVELEILNELRGGMIKSRVAQKTNLSHYQATRQLEGLIRKGYVVGALENEKRPAKFSEFEEQRFIYRITERGEKRRRALEAVFGNEEEKDYKNVHRD
ncbi:MAG: hypothetical protein KGH53_00470 [Candidatus Micrarchaeota archaeon]|nr:hypothetical protein [Candidatus Micrarchaeota archaeon]